MTPPQSLPPSASFHYTLLTPLSITTIPTHQPTSFIKTHKHSLQNRALYSYTTCSKTKQTEHYERQTGPERPRKKLGAWKEGSQMKVNMAFRMRISAGVCLTVLQPAENLAAPH
jgi:hypothetical protein